VEKAIGAMLRRTCGGASRGGLWAAAGLLLAACGGGGDAGDGGMEPAVLRAAAARADVTPLVETWTDENGDGDYDPGEPFEDLDGDGVFDPVWIAGFGSERPALGVHDALEAGVLLLERGATRLAIVSVDWVGLLYDDVLELRRQAEQAGLELDYLVFSSTHNHEGPDTMGLWGPLGRPGLDPDYLQRSFDAIIDALQRAGERLQPVRIRAGLGRTQDLVHDSRRPEVIDETVTALRFDPAAGGAPLAVVVHWGNHPEALGGSNQQITADFPYGLRAALAEAYPEAVPIYWQGMVGGLMNPLHVDVTDAQGQLLPDSSFAKAERLGRLVAAEALAALEAGFDATGDGRLAFSQQRVLAPFQNDMLLLAAVAGLIKRSLYRQDGTPQPADETLSNPSWSYSEVAALAIGQLQIACVPGELYPELALLGPEGQTCYEQPQDPGADFYPSECVPPLYTFMRPDAVRIVLGLANDEAGYLIPKCQWDTEPPYAYGRDDPQYGEGMSPGPEVAPIVIRGLARQLARLEAQTAE